MDDAKEKNPISLPVQTLLIVHSYHHRNTELVARAIGKVLCAQIVGPEQLQLEQIQQYDLLGFGSGIYDGKHHNSLLNLADRLPAGNKKKVFLFSSYRILICDRPKASANLHIFFYKKTSRQIVIR